MNVVTITVLQFLEKVVIHFYYYIIYYIVVTIISSFGEKL